MKSHYNRMFFGMSRVSVILVAGIAFLGSVFTILHVLIGNVHTLPGTTYTWTGHYYLDYFYYLVPIGQGIRGDLMSQQQFSLFDNSIYPHLWPYILLGHLARLLQLNVFTAYWGSVFIFTFLLIFLIYFVIDMILSGEPFYLKFVALLFTLFSVPFAGYDFWYSQSIFFRRFEPIPHHLLSSIAVVSGFILTAKLLEGIGKSYTETIKKSLLIALILIGVASFNSYHVVMPLSAIAAAFFIYPFVFRPFKHSSFIYAMSVFIITVGLVGIFVMVLKNFYTDSTFMAAFKKTEVGLFLVPPLHTLILSIGPIVLLLPFGILRFFKSPNMMKYLIISIVVTGFALYFSDVDRMIGTHKGRFLTSYIYLFYGPTAAYGLKTLMNWSGKFKFIVFTLILLVIGWYITRYNIWVLGEVAGDRNINSPLSYLPKGIFSGLKFLEEQKENKAVLTTPSQFLGQVIPAFVGKKMYVARHIVTSFYEEKAARSNRFYLGMDRPEATEFVKSQGIGFVVLTSIEGYDSKVLYRYPFLKEIYKNKDIVIFEVKEK